VQDRRLPGHVAPPTHEPPALASARRSGL